MCVCVCRVCCHPIYCTLDTSQADSGHVYPHARSLLHLHTVYPKQVSREAAEVVARRASSELADIRGLLGEIARSLAHRYDMIW